jgi:hypothetical protein
MRACGVVFATVLGLAFTSGSLAGLKTTTPGKAILVEVNITDQGIRTAMLTKSTDNGVTTYVAAYSAQRGQTAYFVVQNHGKKPHNFVVFGKKTKTIRPGAKASFHYALLRRGAFPFLSTLDKGKKQFRGLFTVT